MWTKEDMAVYRAIADEKSDPVPFNSVSDALGMSGECLCGAFAPKGELDRIRIWYPNTAAEIDNLEIEVRAAGHKEPFCIWGHGKVGKGKVAVKTGALCTSCTLNSTEPELELF